MTEWPCAVRKCEQEPRVRCYVSRGEGREPRTYHFCAFHGGIAKAYRWEKMNVNDEWVEMKRP